MQPYFRKTAAKFLRGYGAEKSRLKNQAAEIDKKG